MYSIRKITGIEKFIHPAVIHQTLVKEDSRNVEIWMQTSQPGKPTPTHYHSGEEILIVLKGTGWCQVDGKQIDFGPNSVITVPAYTPHKICTTGEEEMQAIAVLETPVEIFNRAGEPIQLPWPYGETPGTLEPTPSDASPENR